MQTYIADIIPSIQRFSKKLDDLAKLSHQHWVSIDDSTNVKTIFIFSNTGELLIYENGIRKARNSWRYVDNQSIDIEINQIHYLMRHAFLDEAILALKRSGVNEYAFFVNETLYGRELQSHSEIIRYLDYRYNKRPKEIGKQNKRFEEQLAIAAIIFIVVLALSLILFKYSGIFNK